jgi:CubicO group peptidase (beta-lactamase class C family)
MRPHLASLLALLLTSTVLAQPPAPPALSAPDDASAALIPIREKHKVPGLAVLVLHGQTIIARGVTGVRKSGSPEPITTSDLFHLGSCTKSMTATLCAMLVEEGKFPGGWTTTVAEVFPDLSASMDPAWRPVTLEQLLTHRAGAPSDLSTDGLWGKLRQHKGTPTDQRLQLVEGVTRHPPIHAPGTEFLYANAGFAIAGAMAEKVTGVAWEDLMRRRLFKPLGMSSAGFGAPGTPGRAVAVIDQPWGHTAAGKPIEPGPGADNPAAIGPAGTVHCSLDDWSKYIALHLAAAGGRGQATLLTPASFAKLHSPAPGPGPRYAMGWGVTARAWAGAGEAGRVLTHNGSNTMWFCVAWLAPEKDYAVLAACNQGGPEADKACDEAVWAMVQTYVQPAGLAPHDAPGLAPALK